MILQIVFLLSIIILNILYLTRLVKSNKFINILTTLNLLLGLICVVLNVGRNPKMVMLGILLILTSLHKMYYQFKGD